MAASSASDITDSKVDYCPCNRCGQARKQVIAKVRELAHSYDVSGDQTLWRVGQDIYELLERIK
jgi:hypothetical protein